MLRRSETSHADSDTVLLNMHNTSMYRSAENYFLSNNNNVLVNLKFIGLLRHDVDKERRSFSTWQLVACFFAQYFTTL